MHYDGNQLRPRYDNFSISMIKTRETETVEKVSVVNEI